MIIVAQVEEAVGGLAVIRYRLIQVVVALRRIPVMANEIHQEGIDPQEKNRHRHLLLPQKKI